MIEKQIWDVKTQLAIYMCLIIEPSLDSPAEMLKHIKFHLSSAEIIYFIHVYCCARFLASWTKYFGYETIDYYVLEYISTNTPELLNNAHLCCRIEDKELWKLRFIYT